MVGEKYDCTMIFSLVWTENSTPDGQTASVQTKEKNHSSHIIVVVFWVMGPMIWRLPVVRQGYDFSVPCHRFERGGTGLKNRTPPQKKS